MAVPSVGDAGELDMVMFAIECFVFGFDEWVML